MLLIVLSMIAHAQESEEKKGFVVPTFQHEFSISAAVDFRGWAGPRLSGVESLNGKKGAKGDLYAGAKFGSETYIGFNYQYGPYAGASIHLGFGADVGNIINDSFNSVSIGLRQALGWVDPLGLLGKNQYVGVKITAGYLYYEAKAGVNIPDWQGGPATKFEMGTNSTISRARQHDVLALRIDTPINAVKDFKLNFAVLTDLDFSRANNGWSIMTEVTAKDIRFAKWGTFGINAHYHHWQGGDNFDPEKTYTYAKIMDGRGLFGSHLVGGSTNLKFLLPQKVSITAGFVGDYQWYFGDHLISVYDDFDMNTESAKVISKDYGYRKGSFAFETGINVTYPNWFILNTAYVSRVDSSYGFSYDESVKGRQSHAFISTRLDLTMLEKRANIMFFGGVSIGLFEARTGFWDQVGRIGWEVGVRYRPTSQINIRAGWHMGSNFIGTIAAPGPKTRDGQFYLRFLWSMGA